MPIGRLAGALLALVFVILGSWTSGCSGTSGATANDAGVGTGNTSQGYCAASFNKACSSDNDCQTSSGERCCPTGPGASASKRRRARSRAPPTRRAIRPRARRARRRASSPGPPRAVRRPAPRSIFASRTRTVRRLAMCVARSTARVFASRPTHAPRAARPVWIARPRRPSAARP